jgi:hypothetical protein
VLIGGVGVLEYGLDVVGSWVMIDILEDKWEGRVMERFVVVGLK